MPSLVEAFIEFFSRITITLDPMSFQISLKRRR